MSTGEIIGLAGMGVLFLIWAVLMFVTLFQLRRRAVARTQNAMPGPITALKEWRIWLTSPEDKAARLRLGAVTLAMFAWIFARLWMLG